MRICKPLPRHFLPLFIVLMIITGQQQADAAEAIQRVATEVAMSDWTSKAELTLPANSNSREPVPGVLLIHGATPADMDFTVGDFTGGDFSGGIRSHILKDIAEHLSQSGYGVLRYHKHYVSGPMQVDYQKYAALSLTDLVEDARAALNVLRQRPEIDPERIYVYGWSEGSLVATALAADEEIDGLILQGAVAEPLQDVFRSQWNEVAIPFVRELTGDAKLTGHDIRHVFRSDAGMLVKGYAGMAMDRSSGFSQPKINRDLDSNGDGQLDMRTELMPLMLEGSAGYTNGENSLPPLLEQEQALRRQPVLLLHGQNDANVPYRNAEKLKELLGKHAQLLGYPALGHSLGEARTTAVDDFLPIAQAPLNDMRNWLDTQSRGDAGGGGGK